MVTWHEILRVEQTKILLENILKKLAYGKKDNDFNSVKKNIGSLSFRKDSWDIQETSTSLPRWS